MGSTVTDRIAGVSTSVAIKAPVKAITQSNISLSGLGVQAGGTWSAELSAGDRILVKDQDDAKENGIYTVFTSEWRRAKDFDGYRDVVKGTAVALADSGDRYLVTTENPIVIGSSEISFAPHPDDFRVMFVGSVAELEGLSLPVGTRVELNDEDVEGTFVVEAGDFSAQLSSDTYNIRYVGLSDDPTALTKVAKRRIKDAVFVDWTGYDGTGVAEESARFQAAIDALDGRAGTVKFGKSGQTIRTTSPVYLRASYQKIDYGEGTTHKHEGANAAITVDPVLTLVNYCHIKGECMIRTDAANGIAVDFTKMSYSTIEPTISVRMGSSTGAVGYYAEGNGAGTGPYYNNIGAGIIYGTNATGQKAVVLAPAIGFAGTGDGPNGNNFTNIKRIAAVRTGFDIQSGNGNLFTTIQTEAIADYLFEFNNRTADFTGTATSGTAGQLTDTGASFEKLAGGCVVITAGTNAGESSDIRSSTATSLTLDRPLPVPIDNTSVYEVYASRAIGNRIIQLRSEGQATAKIAKFHPGAYLNKMQSMHLTSMSGTYYEDETGGFSNVVGDDLFTLDFYGENLAASATTNLSPFRTSFEGGIAVPVGCVVEGIVVTANRHTAGAADVLLYVEGTLRKTFSGVLTGDRLSSSVLRESAPTTGANLLRTGSRVQIDITTDVSWAASGTADVHVSVLCRRL
jgi:hypothetical protein